MPVGAINVQSDEVSYDSDDSVCDRDVCTIQMSNGSQYLHAEGGD